ncbi:hypothetical protein [Kordiimonas pumila]|uniref:Uncharacterized protein n=1 Tax=Kordiimonas pumila TaxID=2161677 RepID=A0ABV7D3R1_9PROT|nr:hypothetical protein [Kordiimonas pumila]
MKTWLWGALLGMVLVVALATGWFFLFLNPRHYDAEDFAGGLDALNAAEVASSMLRTTAPRGVLPKESWPTAIEALHPKKVQVYPTGVLVKLHGVFMLESGIYFPTPKVAAKIEAHDSEGTYQKITDSIYSYRVKG